MALYLVLEPLDIRGIYATWPECEAKVKGVAGAKFQKVATLEAAEALLNGEIPTMTDGTYAFIDVFQSATPLLDRLSFRMSCRLRKAAPP